MRRESIGHRQGWLFGLAIAGISAVVGVGVASSPSIVLSLMAGFIALVAVLSLRQGWTYPLWVAVFGLVIWSYGFNNVPLIRPIPLVDGLVLFALVLGFRFWWRQRKSPVVQRLLFFLGLLSLTVALRLVVDIPRFGLLAGRDALFAFELWVVFPAIAAGFLLGERQLARRLLWLFSLATAWFLLYPWRDIITSMSPVFGIQRPVPLFAFTTAGFVAVPALFWFLWHRGKTSGLVGAGAALVILLLVQSRGAYLAFLASMFATLLLRPPGLGRWIKLAGAGAFAGVALLLLGPVRGRLGEPAGIGTAMEQLQTLMGKEGPGAGSFRHRLVAWPMVIEQVLDEPLGSIFGVGLGPDLFQGFALGPDVLVRKPHNDFLEIWARLGMPGLLSWMGIVVILGLEAVRGAKESSRHAWILALQITLWIMSFAQPAVGFAYITVVWAGLTGLWIGARLRSRVVLPVQPRCGPDTHPARPHTYYLRPGGQDGVLGDQALPRKKGYELATTVQEEE